MTNLNDTQLVILVAAAQRDDLAVAKLDKRAVTKEAVIALLKAKHLKLAPWNRDLAIWKDDEGQACSLVVTPKALKALGIDAPITDPIPPETAAKSATRPRKAAKAAPAASGGTKLEAIAKLMRRPKGATIADMMAATDWQAHSVRGAISGALKKKQSLTITSEKVGEARIYRIA